MRKRNKELGRVRAGTCIRQCLSYSACHCGTFYTVTMVPLKHAAASFKGIVRVEKGICKELCVGMCVCFICVCKKSLKKCRQYNKEKKRKSKVVGQWVG